jgi:hypothetical protein
MKSLTKKEYKELKIVSYQPKQSSNEKLDKEGIQRTKDSFISTKSFNQSKKNTAL